jgi:hypothetical protein
VTIACAMIVGPGEADRHLRRVLDSASRWADRLVVVADHVDEKTEALLLAELKMGVNEAEGDAVTAWWSNGSAPRFTADESYVRNTLLRQLDETLDAGDLVVVLDADEELLVEQGTVRDALTALAALPQAEAFGATFFHLWAPDGSVYRCDGAWAPAQQYRVYKHDQGARVEERRMACAAIPSSARPRINTGLLVKHWGYARPSDRYEKYERYMAHDGGRFHNLRHLESILGPGTVRPLPERMLSGQPTMKGDT